MTATRDRDDRDVGNLEKGIRGQSIVVLHNGTAHGQGNGIAPMNKIPEAGVDSRSASSSDQDATIAAVDHVPNGKDQHDQPFHRDVTFADEVRSDSDEDLDKVMPMLPQRLSPEQHIAFLENQRNPKDKGALRIPGPREFDEGYEPKQLDDDENADGGELETEISRPPEHHRTVNFDEPQHPRLRINTSNRTSMKRRHDTLEQGAQTPAEDAVPLSARFLKARTGTFSSVRNWASTENEHQTPYLSWQPTVGRNSAFVDLTEEQREELGGIEYRSLKTLAVVLVRKCMRKLRPCCWLIFRASSLLSWVASPGSNHPASMDFAHGNMGLYSRLGWPVTSMVVSKSIAAPIADSNFRRGFFTPASLFNDLGFTLTPDSMISFQYAVLPLLLGSFLIVIGNTGFPCMLRFTIWTLSQIVPRASGVWEEYRFLLDHPRRCFTLLFPTSATWWLFWILVVLNGLDMIFFVVLDVCVL